jgi:hypothetical protein
VPLAPCTFTYLGKEVRSISGACSEGHHQYCVELAEHFKKDKPTRRLLKEPCDCRCHEVMACPICGARIQMQMALMADHLMNQHGGLPVNSWGENWRFLMLIFMNAPPTAEEWGDFNDQVSRSGKYNRAILDCFWLYHPNDEYRDSTFGCVVCKFCSWEAGLGSETPSVEVCEQHLIECHGWTVEIPGPPHIGPVGESYPAHSWELDITQTPILDEFDDDPELLQKALLIVALAQNDFEHQEYGLDWGLFESSDLAKLIIAPGDVRPGELLNAHTKAVQIMTLLEENGWIMEIRDKKYRATRKLVVRCLEAGLRATRNQVK